MGLLSSLKKALTKQTASNEKQEKLAAQKKKTTTTKKSTSSSTKKTTAKTSTSSSTKPASSSTNKSTSSSVKAALTKQTAGNEKQEKLAKSPTIKIDTATAKTVVKKIATAAQKDAKANPNNYLKQARINKNIAKAVSEGSKKLPSNSYAKKLDSIISKASSQPADPIKQRVLDQSKSLKEIAEEEALANPLQYQKQIELKNSYVNKLKGQVQLQKDISSFSAFLKKVNARQDKFEDPKVKYLREHATNSALKDFISNSHYNLFSKENLDYYAAQFNSDESIIDVFNYEDGDGFNPIKFLVDPTYTLGTTLRILSPFSHIKDNIYFNSQKAQITLENMGLADPVGPVANTKVQQYYNMTTGTVTTVRYKLTKDGNIDPNLVSYYECPITQYGTHLDKSTLRVIQSSDDIGAHFQNSAVYTADGNVYFDKKLFNSFKNTLVSLTPQEKENVIKTSLLTIKNNDAYIQSQLDARITKENDAKLRDAYNYYRSTGGASPVKLTLLNTLNIAGATMDSIMGATQLRAATQYLHEVRGIKYFQRAVDYAPVLQGKVNTTDLVGTTQQFDTRELWNRIVDATFNRTDTSFMTKFETLTESDAEEIKHPMIWGLVLDIMMDPFFFSESFLGVAKAGKATEILSDVSKISTETTKFYKLTTRDLKPNIIQKLGKTNASTEEVLSAFVDTNKKRITKVYADYLSGVKTANEFDTAITKIFDQVFVSKNHSKAIAKSLRVNKLVELEKSAKVISDSINYTGDLVNISKRAVDEYKTITNLRDSIMSVDNLLTRASFGPVTNLSIEGAKYLKSFINTSAIAKTDVLTKKALEELMQSTGEKTARIRLNLNGVNPKGYMITKKELDIKLAADARKAGISEETAIIKGRIAFDKEYIRQRNLQVNNIIDAIKSDINSKNLTFDNLQRLANQYKNNPMTVADYLNDFVKDLATDYKIIADTDSKKLINKNITKLKKVGQLYTDTLVNNCITNLKAIIGSSFDINNITVDTYLDIINIATETRSTLRLLDADNHKLTNFLDAIISTANEDPEHTLRLLKELFADTSIILKSINKVDNNIDKLLLDLTRSKAITKTDYLDALQKATDNIKPLETPLTREVSTEYTQAQTDLITVLKNKYGVEGITTEQELDNYIKTLPKQNIYPEVFNTPEYTKYLEAKRTEQNFKLDVSVNSRTDAVQFNKYARAQYFWTTDSFNRLAEGLFGTTQDAEVQALIKTYKAILNKTEPLTAFEQAIKQLMDTVQANITIKQNIDNLGLLNLSEKTRYTAGDVIFGFDRLSASPKYYINKIIDKINTVKYTQYAKESLSLDNFRYSQLMDGDLHDILLANGISEKQIADFVSGAHTAGQDTLTTQLYVCWRMPELADQYNELAKTTDVFVLDFEATSLNPNTAGVLTSGLHKWTPLEDPTDITKCFKQISETASEEFALAPNIAANSIYKNDYFIHKYASAMGIDDWDTVARNICKNGTAQNTTEVLQQTLDAINAQRVFPDKRPCIIGYNNFKYDDLIMKQDSRIAAQYANFTKLDAYQELIQRLNTKDAVYAVSTSEKKELTSWIKTLSEDLDRLDIPNIQSTSMDSYMKLLEDVISNTDDTHFKEFFSDLLHTAQREDQEVKNIIEHNILGDNLVDLQIDVDRALANPELAPELHYISERYKQLGYTDEFAIRAQQQRYLTFKRVSELNTEYNKAFGIISNGVITPEQYREVMRVTGGQPDNIMRFFTMYDGTFNDTQLLGINTLISNAMSDMYYTVVDDASLIFKDIDVKDVGTYRALQNKVTKEQARGVMPFTKLVEYANSTNNFENAFAKLKEIINESNNVKGPWTPQAINAVNFAELPVETKAALISACTNNILEERILEQFADYYRELNYLLPTTEVTLQDLLRESDLVDLALRQNGFTKEEAEFIVENWKKAYNVLPYDDSDKLGFLYDALQRGDLDAKKFEAACSELTGGSISRQHLKATAAKPSTEFIRSLQQESDEVRKQIMYAVDDMQRKIITRQDAWLFKDIITDHDNLLAYMVNSEHNGLFALTVNQDSKYWKNLQKVFRDLQDRGLIKFSYNSQNNLLKAVLTDRVSRRGDVWGYLDNSNNFFNITPKYIPRIDYTEYITKLDIPDTYKTYLDRALNNLNSVKDPTVSDMYRGTIGFNDFKNIYSNLDIDRSVGIFKYEEHISPRNTIPYNFTHTLTGELPELANFGIEKTRGKHFIFDIASATKHVVEASDNAAAYALYYMNNADTLNINNLAQALSDEELLKLINDSYSLTPMALIQDAENIKYLDKLSQDIATLEKENIHNPEIAKLEKELFQRQPYQVKFFEINNLKDLQAAKEAGVCLVPIQIAETAFEKINYYAAQTPILQAAQKYLVIMKCSYLTRLGTVVRNTIDEFFKSVIDVGLENTPSYLRNFVQSIADFNSYNEILSIMQKEAKSLMIPGKNADELYRDLVTKGVIPEYLALRMPFEDFSRMHTFMLYGASGGTQTSVIQKSLLKQKLGDLPVESYGKGPIATGIDAAKNMEKTIENVKSITDYFRDSLVSATLMPLEMSEKLTRYSHYLTLQDMGLTDFEQFGRVSHTHFNYNVKSKAMAYTELLIPFMNFQKLNLDYWGTQFLQNAHVIHNYMRIEDEFLAPAMSEFAEVQREYDYIDNPYERLNFVKLNQLLSGAVPLEGMTNIPDQTMYLKLNPSLYDAFAFLMPASKLVGSVFTPLQTIINQVPNIDLLTSQGIWDGNTGSGLLSLIPYYGTMWEPAHNSALKFMANTLTRPEDMFSDTALAKALKAPFGELITTSLFAVDTIQPWQIQDLMHANGYTYDYVAKEWRPYAECIAKDYKEAAAYYNKLGFIYNYALQEYVPKEFSANEDPDRPGIYTWDQYRNWVRINQNKDWDYISQSWVDLTDIIVQDGISYKGPQQYIFNYDDYKKYQNNRGLYWDFVREQYVPKDEVLAFTYQEAAEYMRTQGKVWDYVRQTYVPRGTELASNWRQAEKYWNDRGYVYDHYRGYYVLKEKAIEPGPRYEGYSKNFSKYKAHGKWFDTFEEMAAYKRKQGLEWDPIKKKWVKLGNAPTWDEMVAYKKTQGLGWDSINKEWVPLNQVPTWNEYQTYMESKGLEWDYITKSWVTKGTAQGKTWNDYRNYSTLHNQTYNYNTRRWEGNYTPAKYNKKAAAEVFHAKADYNYTTQRNSYIYNVIHNYINRTMPDAYTRIDTNPMPLNLLQVYPTRYRYLRSRNNAAKYLSNPYSYKKYYKT